MKTSFQSVRNFTLLVLLSIQVGVNPVMIKWYAHEATNVRVRCTVIDIMKIIIALVFLMAKGELATEYRTWSFRLAVKTTLFPSLVYAVQNYLNQNAVTILDGVMFNILNQTKIMWTAILVYVMLRQKQSQVQLVALLLLLCGATLMATTRSSSSGEEATVVDDGQNKYVGIFQALLAACLSGIAGTVIQKGLQDQQRNAYSVTIELSVFGIFGLWLSKWILDGVVFMASHAVVSTSEFKSTEEQDHGLWHGWTFMTWNVMALQAIGGVLIGFVMKYSGNIEKNFAVVAGLILTAFLESIFNHKPFGFGGIVCIGLVSTSSYLYAKYPYRASKILVL